MTTRHFYCIEYPLGFDRQHPVFPFKVKVHRYDSKTDRDNRLAVERFKTPLRSRFHKVTSLHKLVTIAYTQSEALAWPVEITVRSAQQAGELP